MDKIYTSKVEAVPRVIVKKRVKCPRCKVWFDVEITSEDHAREEDDDHDLGND